MLTSGGAQVLLPLSPGRSSCHSGGHWHLSTHQDGPCHLMLPHKVIPSLLSCVAVLAAKLPELSWIHVLPLQKGIVQSPGENRAGEPLFHRSPL